MSRVQFLIILQYIERNKLILGIYVVYTKAIIHINVNVSVGYLPDRKTVR